MSCLCAAQLNFWFQTELRRENLASYYRQRRQLHLTLHTMVMRFYHALRPIFMFWLVKIWQVSSCGKFMQHLESCLLCLLWQLRLTKFCVNLWCFSCFFPLDVQNEIQLLPEVFCYSWLVLFIGLLVEKYVTCQSRKSDFGWPCFRFSPCLMCKPKSWKVLYLKPFRSCISNGKPE